MKEKAKALPVFFFRGRDNYEVFHKALNQTNNGGSRGLADAMTIAMSELCSEQKELYTHVYVPHWDAVTDPDARTLRNILKTTANGKPKSYSREYDLLQYLSLCLQYMDESYARYVADWCLQQTLRSDDAEEPMGHFS